MLSFRLFTENQVVNKQFLIFIPSNFEFTEQETFTEEATAKVFYEKFNEFEPPSATFRAKNASLTQEQERAEEQLILKVSFCYIIHRQSEQKLRVR